MSNIIDSIQLSGVTYDLVGSGGGEGTVSALTETNPVVLKGNYSTYYTATTIDAIYVISRMTNSFSNYYVMQGETSDSKGFDILAAGDKNGITSIASSTAFTSTISDGIAKIEFVSPLELRRVYDTNTGFVCYYFPPTPYTSGSTSEVVEGAVYDSLRQLSLGVITKDSIASVSQNLSDSGLGIVVTTDKGSLSSTVDVSSPTINMNGGKLNTQFSSSTASQVVLNSGSSNYCQMFYGKSYGDLTITFNPSYTGSSTSTTFRVSADFGYNTYSANFTYDITGNSVSYGRNWSTYFSTVDTLSTDHKLKIVPNTGYNISSFRSNDCLIGGVDTSNPNDYVTNLVTTTSNIHGGQEVIDDLYANKQDKLSAGTNITIVDNVISATGGGGGGNPTVELTQDEYDALVTAGTVQADTYYIISDAAAIDLSNYYTTAQTQSVINQATSGLQVTLTAGTGIDITNNVISTTGGGGGKAVTGGTNISVTTGETADTINCTLPITAGTNSNGQGIIIGDSECSATGKYSIAIGHNADANGGHLIVIGDNYGVNANYGIAVGSGTISYGYRFISIGDYNNISMSCSYVALFGYHATVRNSSEVAIGEYNISNTGSTVADKTRFSIGNGYHIGSVNVDHNILDVRQNGDIYIANTNDTSTSNYYEKPMIKLQDALSMMGGLKLVKLTQTEYDNLGTKDSNTVYFIGDSNGYTMKIGNASVN